MQNRIYNFYLYSQVPKRVKSINKNMKVNYSQTPFKIYNTGNNKTVKLMDIVKFYGKNFKEKIKKNFRRIQQGDVEKKYANINSLKKFRILDLIQKLKKI